jgi:hypothetical protein
MGTYICLMEAYWMQGCGSGRRLSSLRMLVSSWSLISTVSAASMSWDRLVDLRQMD